MPDKLVIQRHEGGFQRGRAVAVVRESGVVKLAQATAQGPFGISARGMRLLEDLVEAVDLGLAAHHGLTGLVLKELTPLGSFESIELKPIHQRLLAAFQIVTTADEGVRRLSEHFPVPEVKGGLELDGIDALLAEADPARLAHRILAIVASYVEIKARGDSDNADFIGTATAAGLELLRRTIATYATGGTLRSQVDALGQRQILVAGYPYDGLSQRKISETPSGLLPMMPEHIVGNASFLEAGLRLCRDIAGYDLEMRRNPKMLNPILFGLGSPGCGKTVTAHAIGNYFLRYCRERDLPARFLVVRRSDWASSYQNASAANLIRLFREELYGFDGVSGAYWPDIDTALASRGSDNLRTEEKQNLGAVFGIFDGTLLPKDGKWFMVCDANTMHMDEAAISRIAQNPFSVEGPVTAGDYVALMKICLKDVQAFLPIEEDGWLSLGELARGNGLSGRNVHAICGNVRARIQDFEYPEEYFKADSLEKEQIIARLSHPLDVAAFGGAIRSYVEFQQAAQQKEEQERFQREVDQVVRQLNASRKAAERLTETHV